MLNTNRNINLAIPLVRAGGKGPDILPYLNNLRMFVYYTDIPSETDLTGRKRDQLGIFTSSYRWQPYYEESALSASVSGALWNTLTADSQISQSFMTRSVGEGVYFTGSLGDPPSYSTNADPNSTYQVFISGSSALSDISSSWTYVTYIKPDPIAQTNFNYGLYAQNLYNYTRDDGIYVKAAALDLSSDPNRVIVSTGEFFGGIPNRIYSGSFNFPGGINLMDGNYHMITVTVNNYTASVYVDNQLTSGSGTTQLEGYAWNGIGGGAGIWKNMNFGSNVVHSVGLTGKQYYRAYNGWNKGIAIWDKGFTAADVSDVYGIFVRDFLAPARSVETNT